MVVYRFVHVYRLHTHTMGYSEGPTCPGSGTSSTVIGTVQEVGSNAYEQWPRCNSSHMQQKINIKRREELSVHNAFYIRLF